MGVSVAAGASVTVGRALPDWAPEAVGTAPSAGWDGRCVWYQANPATTTATSITARIGTQAVDLAEAGAAIGAEPAARATGAPQEGQKATSGTSLNPHRGQK